MIRRLTTPSILDTKVLRIEGRVIHRCLSLHVSLSKFEPKPIPNSRWDNITIELYEQFARPYTKCVGIARVLHTSRLSNVLDADCEV